MQPKTMATAGLIVIKERKLLLTFSRNKKAFYLPGGKLDANEPAVHALIREVEEELNVHLTENDLEYFGHISAQAFGENEVITMEQDCFICKPLIDPQPSNEIDEIKYFSSAEYNREPKLVPGVITAFEMLKQKNLAD